MTMINIIKRTDAELKTDVLSELKYEPGVKVTDIDVLVKDSTVTLNGYATNYMEKGEAVRTAKRIAGVKAIADDIEVQLPGSQHRTDGDIAAAGGGWVARGLTQLPGSENCFLKRLLSSCFSLNVVFCSGATQPPYIRHKASLCVEVHIRPLVRDASLAFKHQTSEVSHGI